MTAASASVPLRIALVTAQAARSLDGDLPILADAVRAAGAEASTPAWDDPAVDWRRFDLAVLRSTWDYCERIGEFLAWADRCAAETRLLNGPALVRFSVDKHYLADLARRGVPVVPTRYVEPRDDPACELAAFLDRHPPTLHAGSIEGFDEFVVKPSIGAGSRDAARYHRSDRDRACAHVARLNAAGRSVLLQPYLRRIDEHGETSMIFLGGDWSHAVRKGPLLEPGAGVIAGFLAPETITRCDPDAAERAVAAAALAAVSGPVPLYGRVDLIRGDRGEALVLELELCEPSLFFAHAPGAATRFAQLLVGCATA
jgi:O-ureido-D-serine cyclo-ligase